MKNGISIPIKCRWLHLFWFLCSHLCVHPFHSIRVVLHPTIEMHRTHVFRPGFFPRVSIAQPIIRLLHLSNYVNHLPRTKCTKGSKIQFTEILLQVYFHLPALYDFLIKDSKLITDSISIRCQPQGCHGVQEAS